MSAIDKGSLPADVVNFSRISLTLSLYDDAEFRSLSKKGLTDSVIHAPQLKGLAQL
jgi:hypothetical protein